MGPAAAPCQATRSHALCSRPKHNPPRQVERSSRCWHVLPLHEGKQTPHFKLHPTRHPPFHIKVLEHTPDRLAMLFMFARTPPLLWLVHVQQLVPHLGLVMVRVAGWWVDVVFMIRVACAGRMGSGGCIPCHARMAAAASGMEA